MKLFLVVLVFFAVAYGRNTPKNFPQCKRSDPHIEKCILKGIETLRPSLATGVPEINLPALDPFKLARLDVDTSLNGMFLKAEVTNIIANGGSDFKIEHLKVDLDNKYVAEVKIMFPILEITAEYNARGTKVLHLPFNGRGEFEALLFEVTVVANSVASPVEKDGKEYLQLDSLTTKVVIGGVAIKGSESKSSLIGNAGASFMNSNPSEVMDMLASIINEKTALIAKEYVDRVLASVPIKDVLIDS